MTRNHLLLMLAIGMSHAHIAAHSYGKMRHRALPCAAIKVRFYCMAMLTSDEGVTGRLATAGATHEALRVVFPTPLPDLLSSLMTGTHAQSAQFLSHIRGYNSALSMASSGGTIANPPAGISMFAIRGRMYHLIGPPHPVTGEAPRFAQL